MSLFVAEHAARTDPGRQRRGNEDAYYVGPPLFAVADGMGGAQAGEVASQTVVELLENGLPDGDTAEARLGAAARAANERVHALARADRERAGMGTTLIAAMLTEDEVSIAHVGDSRAYRLRGDQLEPLTKDHSLVQALIDQGRLSEEEAATHPQRSIITRALGPEPGVEVDTLTYPARPGDLFLLCSDGLTGMISEEEITDLLRMSRTLDDAAAALVQAANEAGGRDNITVVLFRVNGDAGGLDGEEPTAVEQPTDDVPVTQQHTVVSATTPRAAARAPRMGPGPDGPRDRTGAVPVLETVRPSRPTGTRARRARRLRGVGIAVLVLLPILAGAWIASRAVFFVGTNRQGIVTVFRGLPYELPAGLDLYQKLYVSGVPASTIAPRRRGQLLDHKLRSQRDALDLVDQLEQGQPVR